MVAAPDHTVIVTEATTEDLVIGLELVLQQLVLCFFIVRELKEIGTFVQNTTTLEAVSETSMWLTTSIATVLLLRFVSSFNAKRTDEDIKESLAQANAHQYFFYHEPRW